MSTAPAPSAAAVAVALSGVTLPTALVQGELVKIGLRANSYAAYAIAGSTVSQIIQASSINKDNGNPSCVLTVPPGTNQGASIQSVVYGKVIGVRFQRDTATPPQFSVVIDGVSYAVVNAPYRFNGQPAIVSTTEDGDSYQIVASNLPDGPHSVEVILAADPLGITTYTLTLYGFVAERRVGYVERHGSQNIIGQGLLTGTATTIGVGPNGLRKIYFTNTGATVGMTTVTYGGSIVFQTVLAASGSPGCSDSFDPGDYTADSQYKVSGPITVQYTAYGIYV